MKAVFWVPWEDGWTGTTADKGFPLFRDLVNSVFFTLIRGEIFVEEKSAPGQPQLLADVARGSERAFKQLVDKYSDRLGHFIATITKDHQVAQEVVQDVFLKIWQNRETLVTVRDFHRWLFVISKHQALNALRKAIVKQTTLDEHLADPDNNEWVLEKERRFCLLDEAVDRLPEQQRKVYLLSRRSGKTYKQIAADMQLSPETVKKYIQLAVTQIIRHVEKGATLTFFYFFIK